MSDLSETRTLAVNLAEAAARGERVELALEGSELPRLAALAAQAAADAVGGEAITPALSAVLQFEPHETPRFVAVTAHVTARCALPCQRCLELVRVDVEIEVVLAVGDRLDDEAIEALDTTYERWDHEGETLEVTELAEELVLLDLPLVVMHERLEDCGPLARQLPEASATTGTQRPFAGLQGLLAGEDEQN